MKKWTGWLIALVVVLTLAVPTVTFAAGGRPPTTGFGRGYFYTYTGEPLTDEQQAALEDFLVDEHRALTTYEGIMAQFGEVQPFASIAHAEEQHIAALESVFERYDLQLPEIPDFDVPTFDSVEAACAAGAQAEINNAALYDELSDVFTQADILRVTEHLRNASLQRHLPAFEACANGEYTVGMFGGGMGGYGYGRGGGAWAEYPEGTAPMMGQGMGGGMMGRGFRGRGNTQAPRLNLNPDCPYYEAPADSH